MTPPSWQVLGSGLGLSELLLLFWKRSKTEARQHDAGSLRWLWIAVLASIGLAVFLKFNLRSVSLPPFLYPAGFALFTAGIILRWISIIYLGRFFTVDVAIAHDHHIVDSGPYRLIRHPSYTGLLLTMAGLGVCLLNMASLFVIVIPATLAFLHRISIEEKALRAQFGPEYDDYARRTKRLIPFIY